MESSTTDVCEWCKRPMLSPGGTATASEAQEDEIAEGTAPLGGESDPAAGLTADQSGASGSQKASDEHVLRPLGGAGAGPRPGMPSHGVGREATETSVDLSQYTGEENSIFRPIKGPERTGAMGGADPLAARRKREEKQAKSEIPDNVRLMRSVIAGPIASLAVTLIQFVLSRATDSVHGLPPELRFASVRLMGSVGDSDGLLWVLVYGVLVGLLMGLGLGAVLVRFRRGPFAGMIVGLLVGYGLINPPWGFICGAVTGIVVGRIATVGLRQVLNV